MPGQAVNHNPHRTLHRRDAHRAVPDADGLRHYQRVGVDPGDCPREFVRHPHRFRRDGEAGGALPHLQRRGDDITGGIDP